MSSLQQRRPVAHVPFETDHEVHRRNLQTGDGVKMITVLVNSSAGGQDRSTVADDIAAAFEKAGTAARVVVAPSAREVAALAGEAAGTSDVVVAAGGDGTVSAVASALAGSPVALGIVPLGTLNHFAKDMNIPLGLNESVWVIVAGRAATVDAGEVNGRLFVNNSSIGVYPNVIALREELRREGRRKWIAMAMAIWRVLRTYRGIYVHLTANGHRFSTRTPFVFVGNNEYVLEGQRAGRREHLTAGQLFVSLAPRIKARQLPRLILRALFGGVQADGAFTIIHTADVQIEAADSVQIKVSLDGETATLRLPLHYQIRPGALRVLS
jgi:diacylglycerol kinase family enzyme